MTATMAVREAGRLGAISRQDVALHGWVDWAEWVEPIERSVAAVSASVLSERLRRVFSEPLHPWLTHVVVLVDVGAPGDADAASHFVRVATMVELRAHFPFVDGIAALNPTRYAVLARRHPGLSGTLNSLEGRLREDAAGLDGLARVWCEELPDHPSDIASFVRGLLVKPTPYHQEDRGSIAAGFPVEVLAAGAPAPTPTRAPRSRWALRSAAAAVATATLMSAAGAAAAVGVSSVRPLIDRLRGTTIAEHLGSSAAAASSYLAGADALSMFIPGFSPALVGDLQALLGRDPLGPARPNDVAVGLPAVPSGAATTLDAPSAPGVEAGAPPAPTISEPEPPAVSPPPVPEAHQPEPPGIPEAPAVPEPPPVDPVDPVAPVKPVREIEPIAPDPGLLPVVPPLLGLPL